MGWNWFKFLRIATEATSPVLTQASPAWAQDTNRLNQHDGTNWRNIRDSRVIQLDASATMPAQCEGCLIFNINPAAARTIDITAGGNIGSFVIVRNLGATYNITVQWASGASLQVVAALQAFLFMWDGTAWTTQVIGLQPNWEIALSADLGMGWAALLAATATNLNLPPIGYVYIEGPHDAPPATLWPNTTWSNVSSEEAGAFRRFEGGNANAYGSAIQADDVHPHTHSINFASSAIGTGFITGNQDTTITGSVNTGSTGSTETRPINYTARKWRRIA